MQYQLFRSIIISLLFLSVGFALLHYQLIEYGLSFFVFLPFILGYLFGKTTTREYSLYGLIISLIIFFVLLLVGNLEGMLCILLALPLVFLAIGLGVLVEWCYSKIKKKTNSGNIVKKSLPAFSVFLLLGFAEKQLDNNKKEVVSIETLRILPYTNKQVYDAIKSVDTLTAHKPFLMRFGLPMPYKCILEKESIGGLRICYFSGGTITEKITQLEEAKILRMTVIDYRLTGRKWLGFKEAIYRFDSLGKNTCKLTRITTYTSLLKPRFYWKPLEQWGISQEHDYVLDNLKNDLDRLYHQ